MKMLWNVYLPWLIYPGIYPILVESDSVKKHISKNGIIKV